MADEPDESRTDDVEDEPTPDDGNEAGGVGAGEGGDGEAEGAAADADGSEATDGSEENADGQGRDRRKLLVAAAVVAVVIIAGIIFALTRGGDAPAPATTTSTTVVRTTTTLAKLPAGTVEVATVKESVERVSVSSAVPGGWEDSEPASVSEVEMQVPPASQDEVSGRPAIPTADEPVTGRYAVDGGWEFSNPGPLEPPQPLTFLVRERRGAWVQVLIPVRPNGTVGYVSIDDVDITTTQTRIEINLTDHSLKAYDGNTLLVESPIVIGVNFSPTPTGLFYLTDIVPQKNPEGFYGPFVLATNGYSEMLNEFDNGVPVIAIHGTNNPALMGQDKSNGCIRVPNEVITQLAETMPTGTPILIWP